jgi:hypothetical protein
MNSKRRELYIFFFAAIPLAIFLYITQKWVREGEPTVAVPGLPQVQVPWPTWISSRIPDPQQLVPIAFSSPQAKAVAVLVIIAGATAVIVVAFLLLDLIGKFLAVPSDDQTQRGLNKPIGGGGSAVERTTRTRS